MLMTIAGTQTGLENELMATAQKIAAENAGEGYGLIDGLAIGFIGALENVDLDEAWTLARLMEREIAESGLDIDDVYPCMGEMPTAIFARFILDPLAVCAELGLNDYAWS